MAVSNRQNFTMTADEIFRRASQNAGGGPLDGEELKDSILNLNLILNDMMNDNIPLSLMDSQSVSLVTGTASYALGSCVNDVHNAVLKGTGSSDAELVMTRYSLAEFNEIPAKTTRGRPTVYALERNYDGVCMRVWPTPNKAYTVNAYMFIKPDDMYKYTDNVKVQSRYLPAIVAKMAYELGMSRDLPEERLARLEKDAEMKFERCKHEDRERTSFVIAPNTRRR